jgi:hypothetical protein
MPPRSKYPANFELFYQEKDEEEKRAKGLLPPPVEEEDGKKGKGKPAAKPKPAVRPFHTRTHVHACAAFAAR